MAASVERQAVSAGTLTNAIRNAGRILEKRQGWRVDGVPEKYKAGSGSGYWWRVKLYRPGPAHD